MKTQTNSQPQWTETLFILGVLAVIIGTVTALIGGYWDDAWHTDIGRDTFWSPPHMALYGGVALFFAGVALWAFVSYLQVRNVRTVVRQEPLMLALVGTVITLVSAPIDNFWHVVLGRDAVLWSPPHTMGIIGIFTLASGTLLYVSRIPDARGRRLILMGSASLLAIVLALLFEYDTDVPQFAVFWYLPLLAPLATLAFALSRRISDDPWLATKTAVVYTLLMIAVILIFAFFGLSRPNVPVIAFPALVYDLTVRRRWTRPPSAAAFALAVFAVYVPYHNFVLSGVQFSGMDILLGIPLAILLVWLVWAVTTSDNLRGLRPLLGTTVALLALLCLASPALAHDPGQGKNIANVQLTATLNAGQTHLVAELLDGEDCNTFIAERVIARRAVQTLSGPFEPTGACTYEGSITLPERGRWFVYAGFRHDGQGVEAWLPVVVREFGGSETFTRTTKVYIPPNSPITMPKILTGVVIYLLNILLVGLVIRMFRQAEPYTHQSHSA